MDGTYAYSQTTHKDFSFAKLIMYPYKFMQKPVKPMMVYIQGPYNEKVIEVFNLKMM